MILKNVVVFLLSVTSTIRHQLYQTAHTEAEVWLLVQTGGVPSTGQGGFHFLQTNQKTLLVHRKATADHADKRGHSAQSPPDQ